MIHASHCQFATATSAESFNDRLARHKCRASERTRQHDWETGHSKTRRSRRTTRPALRNHLVPFVWLWLRFALYTPPSTLSACLLGTAHPVSELISMRSKKG